jgi:CubicO group peptidase (beta-lactamase class C family)
VSQELWRKLGAEFDAEVTVDVHGNALADGGISATLRDVGRFGLMFLENGWANGRQIVPVEWVRDCWRGNEDSIAAFDPNTPLEQCLGGMYRNNWWVKDWERGVFYGSGVYGQAVFVHFPANVVMVKFSTWPDALDRRLSTLQLDGFMAIANALTDYRA